MSGEAAKKKKKKKINASIRGKFLISFQKNYP